MDTQLRERPIEILLVEDSPGDARLVIENLQDGKVANRLTVVPDGVEAMVFLRQTNTYASAPRPDLILLDLNLPRKDGLTVLAEIKADPELFTIPVVIMTASRDEHDRLRSFGLQATGYMTKPVDVDQLLDVVRSVHHFALRIVARPAPPQADAVRVP